MIGGANTTLVGRISRTSGISNTTNTGTLTNSDGVFGFSGVANLQGGTHDDTFVFADGANETGNIDGGTGENISLANDDQGPYIDTLDCSAWTSAVTIG